MAIADLIIEAFYELLVENVTMKDLLANSPVLEEKLSLAKKSLINKKVFGEYLEPLRTSIKDEVENERLIQELLARTPPDAKIN